MKAIFLSLIFVFSSSAVLTQAADDDIRFAAVDIYLNVAKPVAAWQFELNERNGQMKVVGVENGDSDAFRSSPYYDREAVQVGSADRIIVADYSLDDVKSLPTGRVRIATLHLMLSGSEQPAFDLQLVTATTYDGQVIDASINLESPTGSEQ